MGQDHRLKWQEAFMQPAAVTLFFFGLASGLPFLLVGGTLSAWLKESGVSLESIGLFSLAGLAYSLKFLWAPATDRLVLPWLGRLGQRRSWLLLAQAVLAASLLLMSVVTPSGTIGIFVVITLCAALAGATLDVVVDAYRIEIAPVEAQGALAATYTLGYRLALLFSGALALWMADQVPWAWVYHLMAAAVLLLMLATVLSREPAHRQRESAAVAQVLRDGVIGPFRDFFGRYAGYTGLALLLFMGLFKLSDQMIGVMALPFYLDCGFTKTQIAAVSKGFGVVIGIAGAFAGGVMVARLGIQRSLLMAMLFGAGSNLLFLLLALHPGELPVFVAVIGGENFAGGFLGTAAVAWLSALVNRDYSATQYALFSSLVALPGKLIGGFSGFMVSGMGYPGFFILSAVAILPALLLYGWLHPRLSAAGEHEHAVSADR